MAEAKKSKKILWGYRWDGLGSVPGIPAKHISAKNAAQMAIEDILEASTAYEKIYSPPIREEAK